MQFISRILILLSVAVLGCTSYEKPPAITYATWTGIGPDKWASAWLISHYIEPGADIKFLETNTDVKQAIAFDIPEAKYKRTSEHTTYESLMTDYQQSDPVLNELGIIVRDIEILSWGGKQNPASSYVESAFRGLQFHFGREKVPESCYYLLFENVYRLLKNHQGEDYSYFENELALNPQCANIKTKQTIDDNKYVAEWNTYEILNFINTGKKVAFIDTRETDEFEEGHIPGAMNIKLRDLDKPLPAAVVSADVVIPYCVKDFRGFEVAKSLKLQGIKTVGLMNPYGIAGWKKVGLPISGPQALSEEKAIEQLMSCAKQPDGCVKNG